MDPHPRQLPAIASVPNLRHVGGLETADGRRVRTGLLYRSGALDLLEGEDAERVASLGIRIVFDLRSPAERSVRPDRVPQGAEYVALDMIDSVSRHAPAVIMKSLQDPETAERELGGGRGMKLFLDHYREFVALPSARLSLGRIYRDLAEGRHRPALIHCMGGKDRTGWTAAALLLLLGVPVSAVMDDYLVSNDRVGPALTAYMDDFSVRGGDPELIKAIMLSRPEYLEASLDQMRGSFGSIERYFAEGLGLDEVVTGALRTSFLE
jgi:protein-tyrosine phosphatase